MKTSEFIGRLADRSLSRRQFNQMLAAVGLTAGTGPVLPRPTRAADEAVYFTWSGYDVPEFFPGYVKKHGANPEMPIFADEEEAFQKMRAGATYDVVHPCNSTVGRWLDADVIQPIDTSRLSNWPDVFESLKHFEGAERDGKNYFVPVDW